MDGLWHQNVQAIRFLKVWLNDFSIGVPYLWVTKVPNPLGVVAVLSAFNFPVAVYGWYDGLCDY
jgi:acyl-CoA reductase-like NAD-dependent aldehyde dehydrogenase